MKSALSLIVVGICAGAYFLYISPLVSEVKTLSIKKTDYDKVLLESKNVVAKRDDVFAEYNNISAENLDKLNKVVPETFDSVLFANDLNAMASGDNLAVMDLKINPQITADREAMTSEPAAKPYVTTVITFRMTGQYQQFAKFLTDIESSLRLLDVVSLSVKTVGGTKPTDSSLEYSLEINTYSLR